MEKEKIPAGLFKNCNSHMKDMTKLRRAKAIAQHNKGPRTRRGWVHRAHGGLPSVLRKRLRALILRGIQETNFDKATDSMLLGCVKYSMSWHLKRFSRLMEQNLWITKRLIVG